MGLGRYEDELEMRCVDAQKAEIDRLKQRIVDLEDQHQQDCIRINDLTVTINTLTRMYVKLRETVGID